MRVFLTTMVILFEITIITYILDIFLSLIAKPDDFLLFIGILGIFAIVVVIYFSYRLFSKILKNKKDEE